MQNVRQANTKKEKKQKREEKKLENKNIKHISNYLLSKSI